MSKLVLYVYSTEIYLSHGMVKVGNSRQDIYEERIDNQFSTSNPENPILLWVMPLPEGFTDKHIHKQLQKNGIERVENVPGHEWFKANIEDVKKAYNQLVHGSSRVENYQPRKEQSEAIEKAKSWFFKHESDEAVKSSLHRNRFLLNAKMRFGKCYTGLHVAKAIGARNTIIVTYKPEVISEWMETANSHVDFEGWVGIRAKKKSVLSVEPSLDPEGNFPHTNGPRILCVSLQDLDIDQNGNTKIRLEKALAIKWDLVIFDEVHYGSRTGRAKHILNSLDGRYRLDLSGTPFRLIQQDDFCGEQVYTYSYIDEQRNKKTEIENDPKEEGQKIYREMPNLNISTIEITEDDISQQTDDFLTDDLDFSLNELFKVGSRGFAHEDAVDHFLNGLVKMDHDAKAISVFGKLGSQLGCPPLRHSVWWLNRVDSISALAKKLSKHPYFSKFEIINASGCESGEDEEVEIARDKEVINKKISDTIKDPTKLGTITLTCRRFLTGVTIKEWDSILVLNDVKSAESYYQAIFRVQSAWVDRKRNVVVKPNSWVFDFAISRCLRLTHEYATALAEQTESGNDLKKEYASDDDTLTNVLSGLCSTLDIKRFYEGKLVSESTSAKDILDALNEEGSRVSLAIKITSDALVDFTSLKMLEDYPNLYEILKKIKGYRTQEVGSINDFVQIGKDEMKKKKDKKEPENPDDDEGDDTKNSIETEQDKERKTRKKWFATQIKRLAICMADFIYMTYEREYNINEVINTKSPEFFFVMTGISKDEFATLCEMGFINPFALNKIVREFRSQEESSLSPEEFIWNCLMKAA